MSAHPLLPRYERKATPIERLFTWSPFSLVTMVARIRGTVTEPMLRDAVHKLRRRHPNLRVRIIDDGSGNPSLTSEGAGEIPIEIVERVSDDQWIQTMEATSRIPFDFAARPAIRFILLQSPSQSDLVIVCHHILCDGLSLAYLARDIMVHLGDPDREVDVLPDPVLVTRDTIPAELSLSRLVRAVLRRVNGKWQRDPVFFDQQDYEDLADTYWENLHHKTLPIELTEEQTSALVARCRQEKVTVNSTLAAAIVDAQIHAQGPKPHHSSIGIAGSLRDRIQSPAGEAMGFYAGAVTLKHKRKLSVDFWENARRLHRKARSRLNDKNLFEDCLAWCYLDPSILEAMNFKRLGGLVSPDAARHDKLSAFAKRADVVLSLLKREKKNSLAGKIMGTVVTNLTRLDFPRVYGALELERLILQPGGAFPLSNVNLVLGAVTCAGKLSLALEYAEEAVDTDTMQQVRARAIELLLDGQPKS